MGIESVFANAVCFQKRSAMLGLLFNTAAFFVITSTALPSEREVSLERQQPLACHFNIFATCVFGACLDVTQFCYLTEQCCYAELPAGAPCRPPPYPIPDKCQSGVCQEPFPFMLLFVPFPLPGQPSRFLQWEAYFYGFTCAAAKRSLRLEGPM